MIVELPSGVFEDEKRVNVTFAGARFGFCTAIPLNSLLEEAADANTACEYVIEEKMGSAGANSGSLLDPSGFPRM